MAFLAAAVPYLGGITYGGAIAAAAVVGTGIYAASEAHKAGVEKSMEAKAQARTEADSAKQRELDRRTLLIRALASQNATAGAGSVELGGSIGGIIRRDIRDNQNDLLVGSSNLSARQQALSAQAKNAVRAGNAQANISLLDTATKAYGVL